MKFTDKKVFLAIVVVTAVIFGGFLLFPKKKQEPNIKPVRTEAIKEIGSAHSTDLGEKKNLETKSETYQNVFGYSLIFSEKYFYQDVTDLVKNDKSIINSGGGPDASSLVIFAGQKENASFDSLSKQSYDFMISIYEKTDIKTLLGEPIDSSFAKFSKTTIGGVEWTKEELTGDSGGVSMATTKNGLTYDIFISGKKLADLEKINQISSSFTFTK